ncbi:MAG: DUF433 domain-containing protein [Nanoarchaeota archaeon]
MRIEINEYIVIDSEICHGKPTFSGTRIIVQDVLEMLKAESNIREIIEAYPSLTKEHIKAAIDFSKKGSKRSFKIAQ